MFEFRTSDTRVSAMVGSRRLFYRFLHSEESVGALTVLIQEVRHHSRHHSGPGLVSRLSELHGDGL